MEYGYLHHWTDLSIEISRMDSILAIALLKVLLIFASDGFADTKVMRKYPFSTVLGRYVPIGN